MCTIAERDAHSCDLCKFSTPIVLVFMQLVAVHLVDSHYCSDPGKFISVLLTSLSTMVQLELSHINVLSKVDLMEQYGKLGTNSLKH